VSPRDPKRAEFLSGTTPSPDRRQTGKKSSASGLPVIRPRLDLTARIGDYILRLSLSLKGQQVAKPP
jgi:hypothetical protein